MELSQQIRIPYVSGNHLVADQDLDDMQVENMENEAGERHEEHAFPEDINYESNDDQELIANFSATVVCSAMSDSESELNDAEVDEVVHVRARLKQGQALVDISSLIRKFSFLL
jgi:hypothetical protein